MSTSDDDVSGSLLSPEYKLSAPLSSLTWRLGASMLYESV